MKGNKYLIIISSFILFIVGCKEESSLGLSHDELYFGPEAGQEIVTIESSSWWLSSFHNPEKEDYIYGSKLPDPPVYDGWMLFEKVTDNEIRISVTENDTGEPRYVRISLQRENLFGHIEVYQEG